MKQVVQKFFWRSLVLVLFAIGVLALAPFTIEPRAAHTLSEVKDESERVQQLPYRWEGPTGQVTNRSFSFDFAYAPDETQSLHLYIPSYEQRLELRLNGTLLTGPINVMRWKGPLSAAAALTILPPELLRKGRNRIELLVFTGPLKFGSLSRLYLGQEADLAPHFRLRSFVEHDLRVIVFGVQAFLALACVVLVAARGNQVRFVWLGISMLVSCLLSLGIFADAFPAVVPFVPWALLMASSAAIGFLGFAQSLAGTTHHKLLVLAATVAPIVGYFLSLSESISLAWVILWFVLPITALSLAIALGLLSRVFWQRPSADLAFLVAGLLLMTVAVIHDQLLRFGFWGGGIFFAQPARMLSLIGIGIFLMLHLARMTRELDHSARHLSERLRQREEELAVAFERERTLAEKAASQIERSRIMAELHDGVAGYLSTIVALSDAEVADQRGIQTVARHALAELRMVIDTLVMPEGDLRVALASLRDRSFSPLKRLGIETEWSMVNLPDVTWLSPEQTLSVLRILQEAISNAVRHGVPRLLYISGEPVGADRFALRVINSGGKKFERTSNSQKYGLANMATRAAALGGSTSLTPLADGAEFMLVLPINPAH